MRPADEQDVTRLLRQAEQGDPGAAEELFQCVYAELHKLAAAYFAREPAGHTLQPTALVHEAYLRLVRGGGIHVQDRKHFFLLAARIMRQILVDHARGKGRDKRGGGHERVTLTHDRAVEPADGIDALALDEALGRLAVSDERKVRLIELRFFAGLTTEESAEVLGVSRATAADDWHFARAWLLRELGER